MTTGRSDTKKRTAAAKGDPLDIVPRLYKQLDRLLDDMESADRDERMTMPQRISGMIALGRIMKMMQDIKRGELSAGAGSAINKYAAAFTPTTNDLGGRGADPRSSAPIELNLPDAEPGDPDYEADFAA